MPFIKDVGDAITITLDEDVSAYLWEKWEINEPQSAGERFAPDRLFVPAVPIRDSQDVVFFGFHTVFHEHNGEGFACECNGSYETFRFNEEWPLEERDAFLAALRERNIRRDLRISPALLHYANNEIKRAAEKVIDGFVGTTFLRNEVFSQTGKRVSAKSVQGWVNQFCEGKGIIARDKEYNTGDLKIPRSRVAEFIAFVRTKRKFNQP